MVQDGSNPSIHTYIDQSGRRQTRGLQALLPKEQSPPPEISKQVVWSRNMKRKVTLQTRKLSSIHVSIIPF